MDDDATEYVISARDEILKRMEETRTAIHQARESGDWSEVSDDVYQKLLDKIELTTLATLPGRAISAVLGIVSAEALVQVSLQEQLTDADDQLQEAGNAALEKLRARALKVNADGVIDVRLSHSLVDTESGLHRFLIVCSGTGVRFGR